MSKEEMKHEINKVLDHFSDSALKELLSFLKQLEQKHSASVLDFSQLQRILQEDKHLLEKLAQ